MLKGGWLLPRSQSVQMQQFLQKKILSIGHNFDLLRFRNAVIQNAGYQVITTKETALVLQVVSKQNIDAVVICNSVPAHLKENIARELKRLKPNLPLIIICSDHERNRLKNLAEEVVIAPRGASQQPLIEAIGRVAGRPDENQKKVV